jgi:AraC-like DNA-binding protein
VRGEEHEVALPDGSIPLVYDLIRGKEAITAHHNTYVIKQPPVYDMHYALEFGLLLSGRMRRLSEDWEGIIGPGQVWFQGAWEPHGYELLTLPTQALVFGVVPQVLVTANAEEAPDYDWMAPFAAPPEKRPQAAPRTQRELQSIASKVIARLPANGPQVQLWKRFLFLEMQLLVREDWTPPPRVYTPVPDSYSRIDRAVGMVLASRRPVSVEQAAKACGMSRNAFNRLFAALMGITFAKYCLRHRLSAGAGQLLSTDDPIKAIAADWGFTSASHLNQCFRKHYGCSPGEYRRHHQSASPNSAG